jgi:hypothetical protein
LPVKQPAIVPPREHSWRYVRFTRWQEEGAATGRRQDTDR